MASIGGGLANLEGIAKPRGRTQFNGDGIGGGQGARRTFRRSRQPGILGFRRERTHL